MANALTAVRLLLVVPTAAALARPDLLAPGVVALLLCVAIATDYLDGPIARRTGTAPRRTASCVELLHALPVSDADGRAVTTRAS